MKLGCSSWSYHAAFRTGRLDLLGFIRICGDELELDGVELVDIHFGQTEPAYLRHLKRECVQRQVTLSGLAVTNDFGLPERRVEERQKVQRWCDVAAYLGAPIIRVFAGWQPAQAPPRDEGKIVGLVRRIVGSSTLDHRRQWSDVAATLRECADYAGERGVTLAIQNSRSDGIVRSAFQLVQLVNDVGSPWLEVCLDPADLADRTSIDAALPRVVQAHARIRDVQQDGSDARIAWPLLLQRLQQGRYRGHLLIDYEGVEDPETAVPRAARFLREALVILSRQRLLAGAESVAPVPRESLVAESNGHGPATSQEAGSARGDAIAR